MKLHRFFIPEHLIKTDRITLPEDLSYQAVKVLRLRRGDQFIVLDNSGQEYLVELETPDSKAVTGKVIELRTNNSEPQTKITLYQSLLPREKFELALQKGVEVGVSKFVPIKSEFTILGKDYASQKLERWGSVIREAAEQSERGLLPEITEALDFKDSILESTKNGLTLIAHPYNSQPLSSLSLEGEGQGEGGINIFVGPEGGFTDEEINLAKQNGALIVNLGPRILRSETTGPILTSLILHSLENY